MIDVTIVATQRPDLLSITLTSFSKYIFPNLDISAAYINLDPIFGSKDDRNKCIEILHDNFKKIVIYEPDIAGFGAAVKRVWGSTTSQHVLHLEDDWIALRNVTGSEMLGPFSDPQIVQVAFATAEKNWDTSTKGHYHYQRAWRRVLGVRIPLPWSRPIFTTSPSVMTGEFARTAARLMDPAYDPEKQFYSGVNPMLERRIAALRNHVLSDDGKPILRDIGREWRDNRNIKKTVNSSVSTWSSGHPMKP